MCFRSGHQSDSPMAQGHGSLRSITKWRCPTNHRLPLVSLRLPGYLAAWWNTCRRVSMFRALAAKLGFDDLAV